MGLFCSKQQQKVSYPFRSEQLQLVAVQFCLQRQQIHKFYKCFASFQSTLKSYLTLDDLATALHEGNPNFAELPFLERLFFLISRKTPGRIFFQDYLTGVSTFCLMNSEAVLRFVFDWLDNDCDDRVTIDDIISEAQYKNPKTNQPTFFRNFIPDIERIGKNRTSPYLKFDEFRQHSNKILPIIWPAYQLQEKMREINLGSEFWKKQYLKIQKAELLFKNSQRKAFRMLDKIRLLSTIKVSKDTQFVSIHDGQKSRNKDKISNDLQLLEIQKPQRRNSCPYIKGDIFQKSVRENERS